MAPRSISQLFNKFAGREIPMVEKLEKLPLGRFQTEADRRTYLSVTPADPNDATLKEMHKTAKDNGVELDIYWVGGGGLRTQCFGTPKNYVIVNVEKEADGKYRVSKKLTVSPDLA